ncbi:MAG: hypothetical protein ABJA82_15700 [Myxococcales bacterium]
MDDAVAQYNLGHFAEASALFEKAYRIDPAPVLLFNIGQCHRRLGNNDLALFFYRQYLGQAPVNAPERPDVLKRVADLERSLKEQADLKDKPPPGVARSPGLDGVSATPSPISPGAMPASPLSQPLPPPNQGSRDQAVDQADHATSLMRTGAWVTGGIAVGALAFGLGEAVAWSSRADTFNNHKGPTATDPSGGSRNCGVDEPNHGGDGCSALFDDVSKARTLAIIGLAGAGALAATSVILLVRSVPRHDDTPMAVSCGPNFYLSGVTCRLAF